MIHNNPSIINLSVKDNSKGQKIAAALYLVTAHLSDTDPVKVALRTHAVTLLDGLTSESQGSLALRITDLLSFAVMARLVSEKNASVITLELRHFLALKDHASEAVSTTISDLLGHSSETSFAPSLNTSKKTFVPTSSIGQVSTPLYKSTVSGSARQGIQQTGKADRQNSILSFINDRKSAGIKDIALLFPDTSEKTIQRELGTLVASGRITKRGQKRWSVYMAI